MNTPLGSRLITWPSGKADIAGIDYGPLTVHEVNGNAIVLKVAPHSSWSGRGQQTYNSPRLLVFSIISMDEKVGGRTEYNVKGLIEIPLGRKKS